MSQEWKLVPVEPDQIHQMAFEEGQPAENGDGYMFTAEEFDLFVDRLLTAAAPVLPADGEPGAVKGLRQLVIGPYPDPDVEDAHDEYLDEHQSQALWLLRNAGRIETHVTRLQAENAALQQRLNVADQRVDELERKAKLYDQLQRGAELLPEGWMITVEVERDGGGVTLIDPQGNDLDYPSNRESMGDEVEDAIEEALAQQVSP